MFVVPRNHHLPRAVAFSVVVAAAALSATAQEPSEQFRKQCEERLPPTSVVVTAHPSDVTYDFSQGVLALTRQSPSKKGEYTLGVTYASFKLSSHWEGTVLKDPKTGMSCARPRLRLDVWAGPQQVSIAREFPQDGCAFAAIAQHELRHVQANQTQVEAVARELQETLISTFGSYVFYGKPEELYESFTTNLRDEWLPWGRARLGEVERVHSQIDSAQEYARYQRLCNGEIARVTRQLARR